MHTEPPTRPKQRPRRKPTSEDARALTGDPARALAMAQATQDFPVPVLMLPATSPAVRALFTPERQRLLAAVREGGPWPTMAILARRLERDLAQVSRDVRVLEHRGLLETSRTRRGKQVVATDRAVLLY